MGYRICYGVDRKSPWKWAATGACTAAALWCVGSLEPVWRYMAAGEGLYNALARYVGGMILGAHGS